MAGSPSSALLHSIMPVGRQPPSKAKASGSDAAALPSCADCGRLPYRACFWWQLVGSADVRRVQGSSAWRARDLKAAVWREVAVAPQWLEVSWRGRRLADDERVQAVGEGDEGGDKPDTGDMAGARGCHARPLLVALLLPRFARTSTEAWAPRSRRKRVINQAAVSALADEWQPGLHRHELDETGCMPSEPIEPDGSAERRPCYPVFVSDLPGFPSPLLRLDLGCAVPTVGMLRKLLVEVTGTDFNLAFRGQRLGSARQYLHRIGLLAGGTVCAEGKVKEQGEEEECAGDSLVLSAVDVDDELDISEDFSDVGPKRTAILAGTGGMFSGSSRKRTLSTGQSGPRGPGGQPSLFTSIIKLPDADCISPPAHSIGGFEVPS